ncbi:centromere protein C-like isoform X3 [Diospyros lotus]|uniref:centromere protein C-like isoform X3 n=1 Tax=Diospyros lotus TaxID=55363 RepID=UPI002259AA2F|nr:centromere protein C-like isoform X3 [Diospyros lotus]
MALGSPSKHLKHVNAIVDGGFDHLTFDFPSSVASETRKIALAAKGKESPQEPRSALGCKRAPFSWKPDLCQPSVSLDPSLIVDLLQDPNEYFLAHERLDNAKEELRRQRGENMTHLKDCSLLKTKRNRRPGIRGKSVCYKHHFSSVLCQDDDIFMSSQETLGQHVLCSPIYISQPDAVDPDVVLQEDDLLGSVSKKESRVNALLDELLSDNCENLDGDEPLSFFQKHLQIKALDFDKLCPPNFHDVGKNNLLDFGEKLKMPQATVPDIHNVVKRMSGKTPVKHKEVVENPIDSPSLPTPPKSSFASLSIFQKDALQQYLSDDEFSVLDLSAARKKSHWFDTRPELRASGTLKSMIIEKCGTMVDMGQEELIRGHSLLLSEKSVKYDSCKIRVDIDVGTSESQNGFKEKNECGIMADRVMDDNDSRPNTVTDLLADGVNKMVENVGEIRQEALSLNQLNANLSESLKLSTNFQTDGPNQMEENAEGTPRNTEAEMNTEDPAVENLESNQSHPDQSSPAAARSCAVRGPSKISDFIPLQHDETSRVSLNQQSKSKRPRLGDRELRALSCRLNLAGVLSCRLNLAGAGTYWKSGVRQSNRIKMRPLEYWKGERFLYGHMREDQSSPAATGSSAMGGPSKILDVIPQNIQEPSRVSMNQQSKRTSPQLGDYRTKVLSCRQSLAGAGTTGKDGVRRRNRIKMKPLEYWKGEGILYGHNHEGLTTIVGMKYMSTTKDDGKPDLSVKSAARP